jgi:hypothetical protein
MPMRRRSNEKHKQAVQKAKSPFYEQNPQLNYRLLAHAEFKKLRDEDDELSKECPHCMEEWETRQINVSQ